MHVLDSEGFIIANVGFLVKSTTTTDSIFDIKTNSKVQHLSCLKFKALNKISLLSIQCMFVCLCVHANLFASVWFSINFWINWNVGCKTYMTRKQLNLNKKRKKKTV